VFAIYKRRCCGNFYRLAIAKGVVASVVGEVNFCETEIRETAKMNILSGRRLCAVARV
jgi:hypothetical protein